ncbi:FAD dependent oxidoreductase [Aspergillus ambiguus]|uniref:NAD(P)/FAD-dependent oxidoreductase n=1 Tax=Aspergillus ambiguus TaxID=176160 RepID=UPI003CCD66AF
MNSVAFIRDLLTADPGVPNSNPTQSYWQREPHALATAQSSILPRQTDFAVIGSGITGLAVSLTLLETHPTATVTVLEARALCSGATGRNGGQMAANAGEEYLHLARVHGAEMAGRIVEFTFDNLNQMKKLIREYAPGECDWEEVQKLRVFLTEDAFGEFQQSITMMERDHPSLRGIYTVIGRDILKQQYNIEGAGGCLLPAGTVWPYKLVTSTFARLRERYPSRLSIETFTPVISVAYDRPSITYPYTVHTARGPLQAGKVAYCTNGYIGHLLPSLRGRVHPYKGTMTVQDPGHSIPNRGHALSWGFHYPAKYDLHSKRWAAGLYYLLQNAKTGHFYFGGEDTRIDLCLTSDDSYAAEASVIQLREKLPAFLGCAGSNKWAILSSWSGIMGFSADGLPVVGQLPTHLTGREGMGEYLAVAFNGYGMANCLMSGKALAMIMLGEDDHTLLPGAYRVTDARLKELLTVEQAAKHFQ